MTEMKSQSDHDWLRERIAASLAGGLSADERSAFDAHAASCETCRAELSAMRELEGKMTELFAPAVPPTNLEDRLIAAWRNRTSPRLRFSLRLSTSHPAIRRAAVAAAAVILLGGFGYVANHVMENGQLPTVAMNRIKSASNLPQIGQAIQLSANENKGAYPRTYTPPPASPAAMAATVSQTVKSEISGGPAASASHDRHYWDKSGNANNRDEERQTLSFADGRAQFQQNQVRQDHVFARASGGAAGTASEVPALGAGVRGPKDANGGVVLDSAGKQAELTGTIEGMTIAGNYFKPTDVAAGHVFYRESDAKEQETRRRSLARVELQAMNEPAAAPAAVPAQGQAQPGASEQPKPPEQLPQPPAVPPAADTRPAVMQRKVIRNGEVEFEVEGFDAAFVTIGKIVAEESGFIATTNSEKLPNGKVKGTIVVRCGPDHLDVLVLKLRGIGELKRQNLTAQDISKEYTDLESELRAAKAMQERLLEIIKSGKGEVKDLVAAEKELGVWRTKSEKLEGQIRYYDNQVALSTLSISLYEKDVKSAAMTTQRENVDLGVEAEDVEKSRAEALKAIDDAKGRIVESELKKFEAGQLAAKIVAEVSPDASGAVIDRLKQLGKVARLEMSRQQTTANGQPPVPNARVERGDTHLVISLYNLANIAPRQTANLNVACEDVEDAYAKVLSAVEKAGGRVVTSNLNRQKPDQTGATVQFEVRTDQAEAALAAVRAIGEVMRLTVAENPDANNVTSAKRGFNVQLLSMSQVQPRETSQRSIAADDVERSYQSILAVAQSIKARMLVSKLESVGPGAGQLSGYLDFEIKRGDAGAIEKAISGAGDVYSRNVATAANDADNTSASKVQYKLVIQNVALLAPRLQQTLAIEVSDVDAAVNSLQTTASGVGGRIVDSTKSKEASGQTIARLSLDVPLASASQVIDAARGLGTVRVEQATKNPQAPDGAVARARLEITVATSDAIVSADNGLWATIRRGLSNSATGLLWSLQLIIIGLCFVGPWVLALVGGWKLVKWSRRKPAVVAT